MNPAIEELANFKQWVCWRYETREGKATKPPRRATGSGYADTKNPATWGTMGQAKATAARLKLDGVGFVFTAGDPFAGVDLDDALDTDGQLLEWAKPIVESLNSYTEVSPSGKGVKIWLKGSVPHGLKRPFGTGSVEIYSQKRYFTVTAVPMKGTAVTIEARQSELTALFDKLKGQRPLRSEIEYWQLSSEIKALINTPPKDDKTNSQADQRVIAALVGRGASDDDIRAIFNRYPIGKGKLAEKQAKGLGDNYLDLSLSKAREWVGTRITPPIHENGVIGQLSAPPSPTPPPALNGHIELDLKNPKTKDFITAFKMAGYEFRLNELDDTVEANSQALSASLEALILNRLRDIGLTSTVWARLAWLETAYHGRYHPIKEWLSSLVWDGNDHIGELMTKYCQESYQWGDVVLKRWFVGAVAKVFEQGQNFMLVIDGGQGLGKSTLVDWLCPKKEWFIEGPINPDEKDFNLRMLRHLVWEVGELQAVTRRSDKEALKGFITTKYFTVRKAYDAHDMKKPAMASLIGTINDDGAGFLNDPTGSRRFVVIKLEKLDHEYVQLDPVQFWAQAMALYKKGEPWRLSAEETTKQAEINARYESSTALEAMFWEYFKIDHKSTAVTTSAKVLDKLETYGLKGSQDANLKELARLMKRLNVQQCRLNGNGRPRAYKGIVDLSTLEKEANNIPS